MTGPLPDFASSPFEPWHVGAEHTHAIAGSAFVLGFDRQLPSSLVRELLDIHGSIKDRYPRKNDIIGGGIDIDPRSPEAFVKRFTPAIPVGFALDSLRPDGTQERMLQAAGDTLINCRNDYTRWKPISAETYELFLLFLPRILEHASIINLSLQYTDRFRLKGTRNSFDPSKLFRNDSPYLSPNVFSVSDLWHSYHGYFKHFSDPTQYQLLNVANSQVKIEEDALIAEIGLTHRCTLETPISTIDEGFGSDRQSGRIHDYMEQMHTENKDLLARIITDTACEMIDLQVPEDLNV